MKNLLMIALTFLVCLLIAGVHTQDPSGVSFGDAQGSSFQNQQPDLLRDNSQNGDTDDFGSLADEEIL